MSLAPIWIDPFWILAGFILLAVCLYQIVANYYH